MTHNIKKTLLPAVFGNIADWYEFYIYAMFAAPIIAKLILPKESATFSLIYVYVAFAMGFVIRPIGALALGYLSDRHGRKKILFYSLLLMGIPTLLMLALPTYKDVGIFSPILLIIIRLLQGFAVGGEIGSATAFVLESAQQNKKNLSGALLISSSFAALLLSSAISYLLLSILTQHQLLTWGWRLPFAFGFIIILIGVYIRYKSSETEEFLRLQQQNDIAKNPIIEAFKYQCKNMLITFLLSSLIAVLVFMGISYMPTYASHFLDYNFKSMLLICSFGILILIISCVIFGYFADIIGGRKMMLLGTAALIIFILPIYEVIIRHSSYTIVTAAVCLFTVISGSIIAPIFANTSGLFPTKTRNTGFGLSFNVSIGLFGGTAAMIVTALIESTGNYLMPAYYIIALSVLFFITALFLPKRLTPQA